MKKKMFKIKRVEEGEENVFTVSTKDGYIKIAGTSEFVVKILKGLCQSEEYVEVLRESLEGWTKPEVAREMRDAGFSENVVMDFEDNIIWDDVIG